MCGIVGYIGNKNALPILLDGIKKLEYRGYDSAGLAIILNSGNAEANLPSRSGIAKAVAYFEKAVGKVANLEAKINRTGKNKIQGSVGIVHSRWSTHGAPTEDNAHPHFDCKKEIFLVHNGIIENYSDLRAELIKKGHRFISETDTEALVHLIEEIRNQKSVRNLEQAVKEALLETRGTYGLAVIDIREPQKLVAARNFSPLLVGIGQGEYMVASDASAILKHTRRVVYLEDGEMAVLTPKGYKVIGIYKRSRHRAPERLDWDEAKIQKGGFPHFMLKEIYEQPEALINSTRGRIDLKNGMPVLGGLNSVKKELKNARRIIISAMGTAYYAGLLTKDYIEELAEIPVVTESSSEFHYRKQLFLPHDIFLCLSQSGETADTLAALHKAKENNILSLGIVNVVGSSIARTTDAGVYQHIGPEIGVASTKAFTSQVVIGALLAVLLGREHKTLTLREAKNILSDIKKLPLQIEHILENDNKIKEIALRFQKYKNFLFLGRKNNLPAALESALKLKEISYVHAEGMSAGEMKHGPIAMIDPKFLSVFIAPRDSVYEKNISNMQEIKARGGPIIAVVTDGDSSIHKIADAVIYIPKANELLTPVLAVVALQLFAYYFAVAKGCDIDKPRNLAKSVTVE